MTNETCLKKEFLHPISAAHCNGRPSCTFMVPENISLPSCSKNATAIRISYNCISKYHHFDMCRSFYHRNGDFVYLHSPDYPVENLNSVNCTCNVTGSNIKVTTLDQYKVEFSTVILTLVTDNSTKNINDLALLNRVEFTGVDNVQIILDNRFDQQVFRLWMGFQGTRMMVVCGSPNIPIIVTSNWRTTTTTEILPTSELTTSILPTSSSSILKAMSSTYSTQNDSDSNGHSSALPINPTSTSSTYIIDQSNSIFQNDSSSNESRNVTTSNQNPESENDQSDLILLLALAITFSFVFLLCVVILFVLVCRKDREDIAYSSDDFSRIDASFIDAYDNTESENHIARF
ncbi:hypothetical protein FSP39_002352 [Pinctada imbricata]|uniref:Uncharacterized protein n=1 Tax=Pinctada imbricata TaxID=66713 RepID=A0AA88Y741_PINIB|nr:hypothetical protein FSP39_002352 [Pinctada imbricata]